MVFMVGLKIKGNVPVHAMKVCKGSRGITPLILNLGTRHMLRRLYPCQRTPVRIEQEAGPAPEPVWMLGEEKNLFPLPGFELRFVGPYALLKEQ
jgi:hypothetical protein